MTLRTSPTPISPQTNVVRFNGQQATYLLVVKHADASTLTVVDAVKSKLPDIRATAPKGLNVALTFDQSQFVRAALRDVVQEAVTAAFLVAVMVLLFLGSPRSMLIVITSIPLSILTAIIGLKLTGQTINTMTLGGIALAVGMLVDDATVEVENIHRNHAMHKPLLVAILDGASQIATPDLCRHAFDLHRLFSGRAADRSRAIPLHPARAGRRVLDADLVPALAHAGPFDGALSSPRHPRGEPRQRQMGPHRARFRRPLREGSRSAIAYALAKFIARRTFSLAFVAIIDPVFDCDAAGGRRGFLPRASMPA